MKNNFTYKIKKDNKKDPTAILIEKGNITHTFRPADMLNEQEYLSNYIKQFKGQADVERAKMKNIEENHPFVLKMSEQDLFTAHMYQEANAIVKTIEKKLPEFEEQLEESEAELVVLQDTLGFSLQTPEEAVDKAVAKITDNG